MPTIVDLALAQPLWKRVISKLWLRLWRGSRKFVWVVEAECYDAPAAGKWRLGLPGARCLGTLLRLRSERHVVKLVGAGALAAVRGAPLCRAGSAPWLRSVAGAPKRGRGRGRAQGFRGGCAIAQGAKGLETRWGASPLEEGSACAEPNLASVSSAPHGFGSQSLEGEQSDCCSDAGSLGSPPSFSDGSAGAPRRDARDCRLLPCEPRVELVSDAGSLGRPPSGVDVGEGLSSAGSLGAPPSDSDVGAAGVESPPASPGPRGSRFASRRRARMAAQDAARAAASRRFDPDVVDERRCMARVFAGGRGGQCPNPPLRGDEFCRGHGREGKRAHGIVGGDVPAAKLGDFLRAEGERGFREVAQRKAEVEGKAQSAKRPPARVWYTRHHMWKSAAAKDTDERRMQIRAENEGVAPELQKSESIQGLDDLTPQEYNECLDTVNAYLKDNSSVRRSGGVALIERNKGPTRFDDENRSEREAYNGKGRYLAWFRWDIFERHRADRGLETAGVREVDCVRLLKETNDYIARRPINQKGVEKYAGPQCFPEWLAMLKKGTGRAEGVAVGEGARATGGVEEQLSNCWRQCADCGRWRLIDSGCLAALSAEEFFARAEGAASDVDWAAWLRDAPVRCDAFRRRRDEVLLRGGAGDGAARATEAAMAEASGVGAGVASVVGCGAAGGASARASGDEGRVGPAEPESVAAGASTPECVSGAEGPEGFSVSPGTSECASDDGGEPSGAGLGTGPLDVKKMFGSRSGGATLADWAALGESPPSSGSEAREDTGVHGGDEGGAAVGARRPKRGKRRGAPAAQGVSVVGGEAESRVRSARLLLTCSMLQKQCIDDHTGRARWETMSCSEADDFAQLVATAVPLEELQEEARVVLLSPAAATPPDGSSAFLRFATVAKRMEPSAHGMETRSRGRPGRSAPLTGPSVALEGLALDVAPWVLPSFGEAWGRKKELRLQRPPGSGAAWAVQSHARAPVTKNAKVFDADVRAELSAVANADDLRKAEAKLAKALARALPSETTVQTARVEVVRARARGELGRHGVRGMLPEVLVLPVDRIPLRVAKYDVVLREAPLRAVQAEQTMLTRMVKFECNWCRERFPAFHPAFRPPPELGMQLLDGGASGVAKCNIEVAWWDDPPPLPQAGDAPSDLAMCCRGVCLACDRDIAQEQTKLAPGADPSSVVPKRSFLNNMDPMYRFPEIDWLKELLRSLTLTESMLLALNHMQVSYVTIARTGLSVFRKNVISFPQSFPEFARRLGLLDGFKVGDRVNSVRGPGLDLSRLPVSAHAATEEQLRACVADACGNLVFPAEVVGVRADGAYELRYDFGGALGVERKETLHPRMRMPWHPKFLRGQLVIMLRRSLGQGRFVDGLEIRWGRLSRALAALMCEGRWRLGEETLGPMHKWCAPGLFDVWTEQDMRAEFPSDIQTIEQMLAAGLHVVGADEAAPLCPSELSDAVPSVTDDVVEEHVFCKWLELANMRLGSRLCRWWVSAPGGLGCDGDAVRRSDCEVAADLYARVREESRQEDALSGGDVTVRGLASWLRKQGCLDGAEGAEAEEGVLEDDLFLEFSVVSEHMGLDRDRLSSGGLEAPPEGRDAEAEVADLANQLLYGWPTVDRDPTGMRAPGRFPKAFPLEFPMGIGDLWDFRHRPVTAAEWVQHLLRYCTGQFVSGLRGRRLVWALVNTVLLQEVAGKGYVVQRLALRRLGGVLGLSVVGGEPMTKGRLRTLIESEDTVRSLVYQLVSVGRDVRSSSMHMSYEGKKLNCAVKYLSWLPPWVQEAQERLASVQGALLGRNKVVEDVLGRGRIPAAWYTLNCKYNAAYDVHRFNGPSVEAASAVDPSVTDAREIRYRFIRDAPDIATFMVSLRAELHMRVVIPAVLPHSDREKVLTMARFETGDNGNPHHHCISYAKGNPSLTWFQGDVDGDPKSDLPPDLSRHAARDEALSSDSEICDGPLVADFWHAGEAVDTNSSDCSDRMRRFVLLLFASSRSDRPVALSAVLAAIRAELGSALATEAMSQAADRVYTAVLEEMVAAGVLVESVADGCRVLKPPAPPLEPLLSEVSAPRPPAGDDRGVASQEQKEKEFGRYFKRLVSEWNPCYTSDGHPRFVWDDDVGAHDIDFAEPERSRLRPLLDEMFAAAERGEAIDLTPLRKLVSALVQTSGRHDVHPAGAPQFGKHACARGKKECPVCRYGFPHELQSRDGPRPARFVQGDKPGSWFLRMPRNDHLVGSYEPHVLLANLGNVDWRPMLNLWAVVEYVTKYAMKAPKGSRSMGELLREVVKEVCQYAPEDAGGDLFRASLQKVYSRTIGGRDYGIFEAVHLGLGLPLILSLVDLVSLNTSGARAVKPARQVAELQPGEAMVYDSKVDKFDKRAELWHRQFDQDRRRRRVCPIALGEIEDVSLFEFYDKYQFHRGQLSRSTKGRAVMVTPHWSADCANVGHERHQDYARTCVVAFWRHMETRRRHALIRGMALDCDERKWGETVFRSSPERAGANFGTVFLGTSDLYRAFEGRQDTRGRPVGWGRALVEMLLDPVLSEWVPAWVVEQYDRWNPFFRAAVCELLLDVSERELPKYVRKFPRARSNRELVHRVPRLMVALHEEEKKREKESATGSRGAGELSDEAGSETEGGGGSSRGGASSAPESAGSGEGCDDGKQAREAIVREPRPTAGRDGQTDASDLDRWAAANAEQQLSAAGPADAAPDLHLTLPSTGSGGGSLGAAVNPVGYDWEARSVAHRRRTRDFERAWEAWPQAVQLSSGDGVERSELDVWQKFAHDVATMRRSQRPLRKGQVGPGALRQFLMGGPGTGKTRTVRAIVRTMRERVQSEGGSPEAVDGAVALAAPTGCASFHMKYGAATLHRVFGINVGKFRRWTDHRNPRFMKVQKKLKRARLFVMDELSMIGLQTLGKTSIRAGEVLGTGRPAYGDNLESYGGRDVMLAGDPKQCQPIGDDAMYKEGAYKGRGCRRGDGDDDVLPAEDLANGGLAVRKEFQDVVILQTVHRLDDGDDAMAPEVRAAYREDADRFLRVTRAMVDCEWTQEDHAWLAQRNQSRLRRTTAGRAELQEFADAPLLMDGRRKDRQGRDGAMQVNATILRDHARRVDKPIAALRAFHDGPDQSRSKLENWDADDFRGMPAVLELCEGARVLLTQNLWVEAGLMNGALGRVVGYVWPEGGDPASEEPEKKSPLCVVVEFDEVDLGMEPDPACEGQMRPRSFFPGEPEKRRWVPIFRQQVFSASEASVYREQFPLTLAWALTHWKAQGMTLRRVRVKLGSKIASTPGVAFVAMTRVRHPSHMVFEDDLPEWGTFQMAQFTPGFRSRRRFELRMRARFSETLRRYGFCEADEWSRQEAEVAEKLLEGLRAVGGAQRVRLARDGRPVDADAWLWPEGEPDFEALLNEEVRRFGSGGAALRAVRLDQVTSVSERLCGDLHMPAVREALGCLVPADLHPSLDGRKPKGGLAGGVARAGISLSAGKWNVDVSEEQRISECLRPGTCEFFLIVLRRICSRLRLPMAIGTVALGRRLGAAEYLSDRLMKVEGWMSWKPEEVREAEEFLVPIGLQGQRDSVVDWILARVSSVDVGVPLGGATALRVEILDNRDPRRVQTCASKARLVAGLVHGADRRGAGDEFVTDVGPIPRCEDVRDSMLWCLGLIVGRMAGKAGEPALNEESGDFLDAVRAAAVAVFAELRSDADESGERDVLRALADEVDCRAVLRVWAETRPAPTVAGAVSSGVSAGVFRDVVLQRAHLRGLTWNVSLDLQGEGKSVRAPTTWTREENRAAIEQEILRWMPDIVALQECPTAVALPRLQASCELLGAAPAHAGFVHLYVRPGRGWGRVVAGKGPGVIGRLVQGPVVLHVAALRLKAGPGDQNASARRAQLAALLECCVGDAVVLMGDMNVREEEMEGLCSARRLREALYVENSWDPGRTRYHPLQEGWSRYGPGAKFDRVLYRGSVAAELYVVGNSKVYCDGSGFYLSDHFGLMSMLDLDEVHSLGVQSGRVRRGILCRIRDEAAFEESGFTRVREMEWRRESAMRREEAAQRDQTEVLKRARAIVEARVRRLEKLRLDALGPDTLFAKSGCHVQGSEGSVGGLAEVDLACWGGLRAVGWSSSACPPMCGVGRCGGTGWATSVVQMLLRLPDVVVWVDAHAALCGQLVGASTDFVVGPSAGRCIACAMHGTLRQMRAGTDVKDPVLLSFEAEVGESTAGGGAQTACDFLCGVLAACRAEEVRSGRWAPWPAAGPMGLDRVTHVDRIFGFAVETRFACSSCVPGRVRSPVRSLREVRSVLELGLPCAEATAWSVAELYLHWCAPRVEVVRCPCCGAEGERKVQRRLASTPNVLLVRLLRGARAAEGSAVAVPDRSPVDVQEELDLPDLGAMGLAGVLYHSGPSSRGGAGPLFVEMLVGSSASCSRGSGQWCFAARSPG